ncbi:MAG: helix-turn-helix domain-containing protein [Succinivibrio sp.]|jgi:transcriptional regulator with XRE-family HTH domain
MSEFGDFISKRRLELNMTLRGFAKELGVSAPYLSDIEKGNREPNEKTLLDSLVRVLHLTPDEQNKLYDMAAAQKNELAKDVSEYVTENDMAKVALRTAKAKGATKEDWERFIKDLEDKK